MKITDLSGVETSVSTLGAYWSFLLEKEKNYPRCNLISDTYGMLLQLSLGVIALSVLMLKWAREPEYTRRPTNVFIKDSLKQASGAMLGHWVNVFFAAGMTTAAFTNQCAFYLGNFIIDSVVCTVLSIILIKLSTYISETYFESKVLTHGDYGQEGTDNVTYVIQLFHWLVMIGLSKLILVYSIYIPLKGPIYQGCLILLNSVLNYPQIELFLVMVAIPLVLNIMVFWVQDNLLMMSDGKRPIGNMWAKDIDTDSDLYTDVSRQAYIASKKKMDIPEADNSSFIDDENDVEAQHAAKIASTFQDDKNAYRLEY